MRSKNTLGVEIPPEIIQEIIESLVFPRFFTPFTYRPLRHSSGHPQHKIRPMIYVSKSWYNALLPLLYHDICIRRRVQLSRLVNTLESTGHSKCKLWLESIELQDVLPDEIASVEFRSGIEYLLRTCPNLTQYANSQSYLTQPHLRPYVYPLLTPPITHLHLQWISTENEWTSALRLTSASLLSLFISFAKKPYIEPHFSFPKLHTLCLPQDSGVFPFFMHWEMPSLTRLLLWLDCNYPSFGAPRRRWTDTTRTAFFKKFGRMIRVLDIHRNDDRRPSDILPSELMKHTPLLEHLILHYHHDTGFEDQDLHSPCLFDQFQSPTLKWIDIWAESSVEDAKRCLLGRVSQIFPNVQGIRIFPRQLLAWTHLPLLITPRSNTEPEVVSFPAAREMVDIFGWITSEYYSDNDSDSDYVNDEETSESDDGDVSNNEDNEKESEKDSERESQGTGGSADDGYASDGAERWALRHEMKADQERENVFRFYCDL